MRPLLYVLCLGVLIGGLTHGTPRMSRDTSRAAAETFLFWCSMFGLLALLVSLLSIIGIIHECSKNVDEPSIFAEVFNAGRYLGLCCGGCAGIGHLVLLFWKPNKA